MVIFLKGNDTKNRLEIDHFILEILKRKFKVNPSDITFISSIRSIKQLICLKNELKSSSYIGLFALKKRNTRLDM